MRVERRFVPRSTGALGLTSWFLATGVGVRGSILGSGPWPEVALRGSIDSGILAKIASLDESREARASNLVMSQAHPGRQIVRHREDISQRVNLKLIKGLVDGSLEQSLQRMQSILNLLLLGLLRLLVAIVLDLLDVL